MARLLIYLIIASLLLSCSESERHYKDGIRWLEKENNWETAAKYFNRAIQEDSQFWNAHAMLIEALSRSDDNAKFLIQLRKTLSQFPDSARAAVLAEPGMKLLGYNEYNKIAARIELNNLGSKLAVKPKDFKVLARCIMAGCRAEDNIAVVDYFRRALSLVGYESIHDTLLQEMRFFIGSPRIDWLRLDWEIEKHPQNINLRKEQLQVGLILGDSVSVSDKITYISEHFSTEIDDEFIRLYGNLINSQVLSSTKIHTGWDASFSPNLREIIFLKDIGNDNYGDIYVYRRPVGGGSNNPVLKAAQQNLESISWPTYSPDGKWIYFYGSSEKDWTPGKFGEFFLYRVRLKYGSRPEKLTDRNYICTPLLFTDDGKMLLVKRDVTSVRSSVDIVKLDQESRKEEILSRIREPINGAVFTPSGDSLLFITDRGIFRRSIEGGKISVDLTWLGMKHPQLSRDGKILKVVNVSDHTLMVDRVIGSIQFLGSLASSRVAFGEKGKLMITQAKGDKQGIVLLDYSNPQISQSEFKIGLQK